MRIAVILTVENGQRYKGEMNLTPTGRIREIKPPPSKHSTDLDEPASAVPVARDFSLNVLAFMKRFGRRMTGPARFTLLVAYMAKGSISVDIQLAAAEKQWNKMTSITGGKFNRAHSNRAQGWGWVRFMKRGTYRLEPEWKGIFTKDGHER